MRHNATVVLADAHNLLMTHMDGAALAIHQFCGKL